MTDGPITQREFGMLASRLESLEHRVEGIDTNGTRGVLSLSTQMADVIKDMTELKIETTKRFDGVDRQFKEHDQLHIREAKDRTSGRRWLIGICVAGVSSLGAIFAVLVEILNHIHGLKMEKLINDQPGPHESWRELAEHSLTHNNDIPVSEEGESEQNKQHDAAR